MCVEQNTWSTRNGAFSENWKNIGTVISSVTWTHYATNFIWLLGSCNKQFQQPISQCSPTSFQVSNTFYVASNKSLPGPDVPMGQEIPYYQWVPIILCLQAGLFMIPGKLRNSKQGMYDFIKRYFIMLREVRIAQLVKALSCGLLIVGLRRMLTTGLFSLYGPFTSSHRLSTGCVVSFRGDGAIFCHTGSGRVGRVWSAREKSLGILCCGWEFNPGHKKDRQWAIPLSYRGPLANLLLRIDFGSH